MQAWVARRDGRPVGRIAAIFNRRHLEIYRDRTGFFGFFECLPDAEASAALLQTAEAWLSERAIARVVGPVSPTVNEESGLLVEGFSERPAIGNVFTPPYYIDLLTQAGYVKLVDMFAYLQTNQSARETPRYAVLERIARRRSDFHIRPLRLEDLDSEAPLFQEVFAEAWKNNRLALPYTVEEWRILARRYRPILDKRFAYAAEKDGRPAGVFLGMVDVNEIVHRLNGRLLPLGWARLFFGLGRVSRGRVFMMGVHPEFQGLGLPTRFIARYFRSTIDDPRFIDHDFSWVYEDNRETISVIEGIGGRRYMTFRLYQRELDAV